MLDVLRATACALAGMKKGLEILGESISSGKAADRPDVALSFEELNDIMGMGEIQRMEERYLTPAQKEAKYGKGQTGPIGTGAAHERVA